MIASLMMYLRPELANATHRLWDAIRQHLTDAGIRCPEQLDQQTKEISVWMDPELVLSQTCGMPYRLWLRDQVHLVGTPDYGLDDCPAGYYRSAIVVRQDDPRNQLAQFQEAVFAYNQTHSQSGYAAPHWHIHPHGNWFTNRLQTGQHRLSALAVAENKADIAALDAMSWQLMQRYEPFTSRLRVLEWTDPTPGLPLITGKCNNPDVVFEAVQRGINDLEESDRKALSLKGLVKIPISDYLAIKNPPGDYPITG